MIKRSRDRGSIGATGEQSWRELVGSSRSLTSPINTSSAWRRRFQGKLKICGWSPSSCSNSGWGCFLPGLLLKRKEAKLRLHRLPS